VSNLVATTVTTIPGLATSGATGCATASQCATLPSQIAGGSSGLSAGSSSSFGLSSIVSVVVEVAALVGIIIIAVVANRADPDPTGRRPQSVYFFVVSFVTITTGIFGSALFVASLLLITAHHSSSAGHSILRLMLVSALIFVMSLRFFLTHLRRGLGLARAEGVPSGPSHRVGQSYISVVSFVSILALLLTGVLTIYLIFAVASPTTFGSFGGRSDSVRILIESLYLGLVAVLVLWTHSSLLMPRLALFGRASPPADNPLPPSVNID
jgi:hypothetical protein